MKTRNVHGGTTHCVDRLTSRKAQAALALAVSLWIATGGVASASPKLYLDPATNEPAYSDGTKPDGATVEHSGKTLTVKNYNWQGNNPNDDRYWFMYGSQSNSQSISGYTLTLDGAQVYAANGGWTGGGDASGNHVTLKNNSYTEMGVTGGYSDENGNADGNTVDLIDSKVGGDIIGGYAAASSGTYTAINNTVSLTNSTVGANVYGGFRFNNGLGDVVTGNTLNLSGANSAKSIANFATVNIKSAVWGTPALTLTGNIGTVNNINTSGIIFSNLDALKEAGENTILIQGGMTDYGGTITGTTYKVGSTLQGKGHAELDGANLKFIADTTAENMTAQEQTHNTVMGAEVGMAALSAGNDFIGAATEGLSLASNVGADGISSFAKMGGGSMRQETGSHVDVHTWNAILALGHANKKERGTFEYGAFFEYGSGNYTTVDGGSRGDGSARYTGGGVLAKWTDAHGLYVEGSLRAGTIHDDAQSVLRDNNGNAYSYETDAGYLGAHLGVGKEIPLADGNSVDVYGKYFMSRRNGVDFTVNDARYDLDAVTSQVLRVGARYMMKREKWNFYGGLAYEHEFDGRAEGTVDGLAIRSADTGGASFRGEIGATMTPDENSPWKLDLNLAGFAGKKQGVTGGVSVAFMF